MKSRSGRSAPGRAEVSSAAARSASISSGEASNRHGRRLRIKSSTNAAIRSTGFLMTTSSVRLQRRAGARDIGESSRSPG